MTIERLNPDSLYESVRYGFSHATRTGRSVSVHCAGQVAWDKDYNLVGEGDVAAQARQALANLKNVLHVSGAQVSDIVRLRTYVVDHTPALLEPIGHALSEFYGEVTPAANTWIGVYSLALPEFLIEIEATAMIED